MLGGGDTAYLFELVVGARKPKIGGTEKADHAGAVGFGASVVRLAVSSASSFLGEQDRRGKQARCSRARSKERACMRATTASR